MPAPPSSVFCPAPPRSVSRPASPWSVSLPSPPASESLPAPPRSVSLPRPPLSVSLPGPPTIVSLPSPPVIVSLPVPPSRMVLIRVLPGMLMVIVSLPAPPRMRMVVTLDSRIVLTTTPLTIARSCAALAGFRSTRIVSLGWAGSESPVMLQVPKIWLTASASRGSSDSSCASNRGACRAIERRREWRGC